MTRSQFVNTTLLVLFCAQLSCDQESYLSLESLLETVQKNHSLVNSSRVKESSLELAAFSSGRKPNPEFKFGYWIEPVQTRAGAMQTKLSLSQTLPPKSRLLQEKKVSLEELGLQELQTRKLVQDIERKVRIKYFEYNFLVRKVQILKENLKIVQSFAKLWETHYSHHDYRYPRLIQLQTEATQIQDQIRETEELVPVVYEELMTLSWRDPDQPLKTDFQGKVSKVNSSFDSSKNIDLSILKAELAKQREKSKLARTFYQPKKIALLEYTGIDNNAPGTLAGQDAWMVGVGIELILDKDRVSQKLGASRKMEEALELQILHKTRELETRWKRASYQVENARKKFLLCKTELIPRTSETLEALQINYGSQNKGMDFFALLDNLRKLLSLNLEKELHFKEYFQARAQQIRLLGKE